MLYSKFGFMYTDVKVGDQEYILVREDDVIGVLPRSSAVADDIPELQPLADRVLIKVEEVADVTMGGVVLPESAKERPQRYDPMAACDVRLLCPLQYWCLDQPVYPLLADAGGCADA